MASGSSSAPPKLKSTKSKSSSSSGTKAKSNTSTSTDAKVKLKSKSKGTTKPEPSPEPLSAEFIDDEAESSDDGSAPIPASGSGPANGNDDNEDDSGSESVSSSDEEDSDADLEAVTPRRKEKGTAATSGAQKNSKSLSRYEPPVGMSEMKATTAFTSSPFEWEALASKPGVELWAIRAPRELKPSRMSNLTLSVPKSKKGEVSGTLKYKTNSYTLTSAGSSKPIHTHTVVDEEGRQPTSGPGLVDAMTIDVDGAVGEEYKVEGGEEMEGMRLLVPRLKQGGKLLVAPIPISRRLILTPDIALPSSSAAVANGAEEISIDSDPTLPSFLSSNKSIVIPTSVPKLNGKRAQPSHLFKFRNEAFGFHTPGPSPNAGAAGKKGGMDVDVNVDASHSLGGTQEKKEKKEKKEKRRKGDVTAADTSSPAKKKAKKFKE